MGNGQLEFLTSRHFPRPAHRLACQRTRCTLSRLPCNPDWKVFLLLFKSKNLFPALVKPGGSLVLGSVWKYLEKCLHKHFIHVYCIHMFKTLDFLDNRQLDFTFQHSVISSPWGCLPLDPHSLGIYIWGLHLSSVPVHYWWGRQGGWWLRAWQKTQLEGLCRWRRKCMRKKRGKRVES